MPTLITGAATILLTAYSINRIRAHWQRHANRRRAHKAFRAELRHDTSWIEWCEDVGTEDTP